MRALLLRQRPDTGQQQEEIGHNEGTRFQHHSGRGSPRHSRSRRRRPHPALVGRAKSVFRRAWSTAREQTVARLPRGSAGESVMLAFAGAMYAVQEVAISHLSRDGGEAILRRTLFFVTTAALIVVALHFRRFAGAWLVAAGIVMNVIPMAAHGGLMPVSYETVRESGILPQVNGADIGKQLPNSKDIVLEREDIRFYIFADRHIVTLPGYGTNIYSTGDFVLFAGIGLVLVEGALLLAGVRQPLPALVRRAQRARPAA